MKTGTSRRRAKDVLRDIARQRAAILYSLAVQSARSGDIDRARDYVKLGLRVLMRVRARRPLSYRRWVCENCYVPLVPGVTARVRVRGVRSHLLVVKRCLVCGWISRSAARRRRTPRSTSREVGSGSPLICRPLPEVHRGVNDEARHAGGQASSREQQLHG